MFTDVHLRPVQQDLIEGLAHIEEGVGDGALESQSGDLVGKLGGTKGGAHTATRVDELGDFDLRAPRLLLVLEDGIATAVARDGKGIDGMPVNALIRPGRSDLGDGRGAGFDDNSVGAAYLLLGLEDRWVLSQRKIDAVLQRHGWWRRGRGLAGQRELVA